MLRKIGNCEVCQPIEDLIDLVKSKGFEVVSEKCRDFHFNEVEIRMTKVDESAMVEPLSISNIELHGKGFYYCRCHWSLVYVNS